MQQDREFDDDFWSQNRSPDPSIMVMKNRRELCEDLKYVTSVPELCDVTFLVGPGKSPVYGIRAILATRSRIMYQMILSRQNEINDAKTKHKSLFKRKLDGIRSLVGGRQCNRLRHGDVVDKLIIRIEDYDEAVFERLMRYIHCGVVAVDTKTVVGLINAAKQFEFPELHTACWDFALDCMRPDTLSVIVQSATMYGQFKETRQLMQEVLNYLGETPDVVHCCPEIQKLLPLRQDEHMC